MVCRRRRDESDLLRAGRDASGVWYQGRGAGRGLWWCRDDECESGLDVSRVSRALRCSLVPGDLTELREVVQRSKTLAVVEE